MALSGSFDTGGYNGKHLTFSWSGSQSVSGNYTDISWSLKGAGGSGYHMAGDFTVIIDGETVYSSATRIQLWNGTNVASGTKRIYHNADGSRSFSASVSASIYTYAVDKTGSGSWALNTIPRQSTISTTPSFTAPNSVTCNINRASSSFTHEVNLDLQDSNGNWVNCGQITNVGTSCTFTADSKCSDGTRCGDRWYSILNGRASCNARFSVYTYGVGGYNYSPTGTCKSYAASTLTMANFNIGANAGITISRNSNTFTHKIEVLFGSWSKVLSSSATTSYTWQTSSDATNLYKQIPNANSGTGTLYCTTYYNGIQVRSRTSITFTANVVNSNPTFSNFTYKDINSKTIALTGSNQAIIKGYSNVQALISVANKAVAKNSASMSKYRFVIGSSQVDVNYSSSADVQATINSVKSNIFTMYAIDSRGNSTFKQISPSKYIDYSQIAIVSAEIIRTGGVGKETTLKLQGSIFEGSFGAVLNAITNCIYKYKETTSSTWKTGETTLKVVKDGKSFSFEGLIKGDLGAEGFDVNKSFDIQIQVSDKLSTGVYNLVLGTGRPAIAIHKNGIAINGMYDENIGGALQIYGDIYKDGKLVSLS